MARKNDHSRTAVSWCIVAVLLAALTAGCAPEPTTTETTTSAVKQVPAGQEHSGFLSDYSKLQPDPDLEEGIRTYVNPDEMKDLHRYVAIIVDPVEVYLATDVDPSQVSDHGREAVVGYFEYAIKSAVADAFPIVNEPGPLVLRLRSALVGVAVGGEVTPPDVPDETVEHLDRTIEIGEVIAEFELVDSETGEVIAAAIDEVSTDGDAEIGATHFSRMQEFDAAQEVIDGWALGLREFLDTKHELTGEDADRADRAYRPY